jgi:hypothetical protein
MDSVDYDITPHIDGIRHFDSREYYLDMKATKK